MIPQGGKMSSFAKSAFEHNLCLYCPPLVPCCLESSKQLTGKTRMSTTNKMINHAVFKLLFSDGDHEAVQLLLSDPCKQSWPSNELTSC